MNDRPNFAQPEDDTEVEGREVASPALTTLMQVSEAEVNQQILTARAFPRDVTSFRQKLQALVCYDPETALSCLYALKRDGKAIQGPSVRFAEAAFQTWGNARCGSRIVDIGDEFITAQGFFWDLEKNTGMTFEVLRRITTREGKRFGDDMIMVTGNAAGSIAVRNAILKAIPRTAWNTVYLKCRKVSVGEGESIGESRDKMVKAFAPFGVDKAQIFGLLGVKGIDDVTVDDLMFMGGILGSIKEGEQTVEQAFALENMVNPDQVAPRRPRQSDFAGRGPQAQGSGGEKQDARNTTAKGPEAKQDVQVDNSEDTIDPKAAREQERQDVIGDLYKRLASVGKVRDVGPIRQEGVDMGLFSEAEEKDWETACDKRSQEFIDAARKAKR